MTDFTPVATREPAAPDLPAKHLIDLAIEVSGWSPCRSKRGVVIFDGENVIAHGYNYKPSGFDCDGSDRCKSTCRVEAVHAEQQAMMSVAVNKLRGADMLHLKTLAGELVPSGGPSCVQCSKLALVAGIAGVWLYHDTGWRRYEAAEFHRLSLRAAPPALQGPQDTKRLAQQCRDISLLLSDAGVGACTLVEGVRTLIERPALQGPRLRALAREQAFTKHAHFVLMDNTQGHVQGMRDKEWGFSTCPHPDCQLVRAEP